MTRYRKKPVEVEAWQVGSDEPMPDVIAESCARNIVMGGYYVPYTGYARGSDWIVFYDDGFEIVDQCIFEQTYEVVE